MRDFDGVLEFVGEQRDEATLRRIIRDLRQEVSNRSRRGRMADLNGRWHTAPASGRNYDVSKDGKRFLMVKSPPSDQSAAPQIDLVQHWAEELKRSALMALAPGTRRK